MKSTFTHISSFALGAIHNWSYLGAFICDQMYSYQICFGWMRALQGQIPIISTTMITAGRSLWPHAVTYQVDLLGCFEKVKEFLVCDYVANGFWKITLNRLQLRMWLCVAISSLLCQECMSTQSWHLALWFMALLRKAKEVKMQIQLCETSTIDLTNCEPVAFWSSQKHIHYQKFLLLGSELWPFSLSNKYLSTLGLF